MRAALVEKDFDKLEGIVEVDETFIGGKAKNKHIGKRTRRPRTRRLGSGKVPVVGAVSRKGNVVARVIDTVSGDVLTKFVMEAVYSKVSLLVTDEWIGYHHVKKLYPHQVIKHTQGEYVVGAVHTNTIEGFWSIFKRGVSALSQGQQEISAAVRRGVRVTLQQPRERGYFWSCDSRLLRRKHWHRLS